MPIHRHRSRTERSPLARGAVFLLALTACTCDDEAPARKAEAHARSAPEGVDNNEGVPQPELPDGTPLASDKLLDALPMQLGEAQSQGESTVQDTPLSNGGVLSVARRTYRMGERTIEVQLSDTLHAPAFKHMLDKQEGKSSEGKDSSWKGITLGSVPGVAQHMKQQQIAFVRAMLDDRILLSVQVQPAESFDVAIEMAQKLPLDALLKLAPTQAAAAPAVP